MNAHHGDTWPAAQRLQPLLRHLIVDKHLLIATLSPTRLELPTLRRHEVPMGSWRLGSWQMLSVLINVRKRASR